MNEGYESIKQGLEEAVAFAEGKKNGTKVHHVRTVDVKNFVPKLELPKMLLLLRLG